MSLLTPGNALRPEYTGGAEQRIADPEHERAVAPSANDEYAGQFLLVRTRRLSSIGSSQTNKTAIVFYGINASELG